MATPQAGIFSPMAREHDFLEFSTATELVPRDLIQGLSAVYEFMRKKREVRVVVGFSSALWRNLRPGGPPAGLEPFRTMPGRGGKSVPSTQNDLWFWLSGAARDHVFEVALEIGRLLSPVAALRLEQPGFIYQDSRDLTGFVDGTANPTGQEARVAALVPQGAVGAGGSHVLAQRWVHNLAAFHALPVAGQEGVIGRTKVESIELEKERKPPTAHVSRVEVELDGEEAVIYRRSVPFGTVAEHGLYFVGFSADPARFQLMLKRMYGLTEDKLEDRLTDFSRATNSAYYFAPSEEDLAAVLGRD